MSAKYASVVGPRCVNIGTVLMGNYTCFQLQDNNFAQACNAALLRLSTCPSGGSSRSIV